jgi:peptide/nickel transport system permease protein
MSATAIGPGPRGALRRRRALRQLRRGLRFVVTALLTLFGLLLLTFFMGRLLPADPVLAVVGQEASRATYDRVYHELGLDRPLSVQFLTYLSHVLRGDLGTSLTTGHPVASDLMQAFPATMELALLAMLFGTLLGVPLGIIAAANRGRWLDHVARIMGLAGHSVPIFWLGLMALFVFYAKLHWVGPSGRVDDIYEGMVAPITGLLLVDSALAGEWDVFHSALSHIILPSALLGIYATAFISRMTRSFMLAQLSQEYIVTARVKGLSRWVIIRRHALPNIRVQLITILALTFGGLLEGAVLVETVFGWPGIGQYLTRGLTFNDMNVVMGTVLLIGVLFFTVNAITDRLYRLLDPRTR